MTEDIGALRRRLRAGTLPDALLPPGRNVVLRLGGRNVTRDELRAEQAMQDHLRTVFDAVERIAQEHAEFFEQEPATLNQRIA